MEGRSTKEVNEKRVVKKTRDDESMNEGECARNTVMSRT